MGRVLLVFPSGLVYGWLGFVFITGVRSTAGAVATAEQAASVRSALARGAHAQVRR
jgi:hypothetical protein